MTPRRCRAVALALAAGLLVAACGDDDDTTASTDMVDETTSSTTEAADDTTSTSAAAETTTTTAQQPEGTLIDVTVSAGEVQGGGRTEVPLGETVTIRVTSDVDDNIHVHGYDVLAEVAAGDTAELTFTADIPGVFEVELEDSGIPLLELEIS